MITNIENELLDVNKRTQPIIYTTDSIGFCLKRPELRGDMHPAMFNSSKVTLLRKSQSYETQLRN